MKRGDLYWTACGELFEREEDLGMYGEYTILQELAESNAQEWLSSLSPREQKHATAWIRRWEVISMDGDKIGATQTVGDGILVDPAG